MPALTRSGEFAWPVAATFVLFRARALTEWRWVSAGNGHSGPIDVVITLRNRQEP
jgi:hypothetical protein